MSIAVIYGSTRLGGNTERLTEAVIGDLPVERIYLREYHLKPIIDQRHAPQGFQKVDDDYYTVLDRVLPHDIIIFSTPIYWYTMSGLMKTFIDRWSESLRDKDYPEFRQQMSTKKAYVIAVGGDEPYIKGLPLIQQFQHIFDFVGITFEDYILGEGNKPDEILQDKTAFYAAEQLYNKLCLIDQ